MKPLQHDPRTKTQIKYALYKHLYSKVNREFEERLALIVQKNTLLGQHRHFSFMYKGVLYSTDISPAPRKSNRLMTELVPMMDQYLKDRKEIETKEMPYVLGFITAVLNSSNVLTDYLKLLPESVHGPINELIYNCPDQAKGMSQDAVDKLKQDNLSNIQLMKERMVRNLLS